MNSVLIQMIVTNVLFQQIIYFAKNWINCKTYLNQTIIVWDYIWLKYFSCIDPDKKKENGHVQVSRLYRAYSIGRLYYSL